MVIKSRRARPFFARHPWVFDSSIERVEGRPSAGDAVTVVSAEGKFIARGLYNPESTIRARLYRWDDGPLDEPFWAGRIEAALGLRAGLPHLEAEGAGRRLIFSEGDGLSGLTVDAYDRWLVVQFTSRALYERRETLLPMLLERSGALGAVARTEHSIAPREGLPLGEETALGDLPDGPVEIREHGLRYRVDLRAGQKTGFYLDQRDNRRAVGAYCRGRRVLDLCCFTGGFAMAALALGGAAEALGIDRSAPAIERAREQATLNGLGNARFEADDVLGALERLRADGQRYDVVVCDPPKYVRQAKDLERGLKGYLRLNLAAIDVVAPGGLLATCSCSGLVGRELFNDVIGQAAERSGRTVQILEQRGQAPDHPVSASCLESEYLKCLICRVE